MTVVTEPCTPARGVVVGVRVFTEVKAPTASRHPPRPTPRQPPQPEPPICSQLSGARDSKETRGTKADPEVLVDPSF